MICPSCGRTVPDGALVCPGCNSSLDATRKISLSGATWCPTCGALVAPGATECPKCGTTLPAEGSSARRQRDLDLPEIGNTGMMDALGDGRPDIESAIPPEDDASSGARRHDRPPRTRALVLAALLAVVVVGGAALLITHPWDPTATRTSTTTPADTSMQGFPGFLESLTGQDVTSSPEGASSSVADALTEAYEQLGTLAERVDACEELLRSDGVSSEASRETREGGLEQIRAVSIDVSNAISDMTELDDGSYPDALGDLLTLGNWLRNRCDVLTSAWELSAESEDAGADADAILAEAAASSDYRQRFEQLYGSWQLDEVQTED